MYTLDRFARNRYDSAIYKAKLKKNGVRVYYAKQPMPDTPEGIILESVLEGYAEYYSENLARNIKRGIRENALQGLAIGGANLLLGYTVGEDRKYAIDPTGAKIVQEIFQLYADGMSATQIIAYCNERGYKTARGNAFNKNSLRTILRNEKYIGTYKLMDIVIPNGMPAIIDKVLFEKVQAMLKHNGKARAKAKAHENYLLTTKLFCGHCGSPMVGESGTSKTGQVHYYYKCTKAKREHACKKKSERKDWIEKLVVRYTVQNVLTDENIALIAKRAMEIIEKESADTTYLDGLNAELKDVQKKIKNLVSAIEQGIITSATKDRLDELEQEKSNIEGLIAREEMKKPLLNENRIKYWLSSFKSGNVNDEDYQRRVIDTLVNSVYVYDDEDGGKRIMLTFNLSGNNTATLTSSDIGCYAPPIRRKLYACDGFLFSVIKRLCRVRHWAYTARIGRQYIVRRGQERIGHVAERAVRFRPDCHDVGESAVRGIGGIHRVHRESIRAVRVALNGRHLWRGHTVGHAVMRALDIHRIGRHFRIILRMRPDILLRHVQILHDERFKLRPRHEGKRRAVHFGIGVIEIIDIIAVLQPPQREIQVIQTDAVKAAGRPSAREEAIIIIADTGEEFFLRLGTDRILRREADHRGGFDISVVLAGGSIIGDGTGVYETFLFGEEQRREGVIGGEGHLRRAITPRGARIPAPPPIRIIKSGAAQAAVIADAVKAHGRRAARGLFGKKAADNIRVDEAALPRVVYGREAVLFKHSEYFPAVAHAVCVQNVPIQQRGAADIRPGVLRHAITAPRCDAACQQQAHGKQEQGYQIKAAYTAHIHTPSAASA